MSIVPLWLEDPEEPFAAFSTCQPWWLSVVLPHPWRTSIPLDLAIVSIWIFSFSYPLSFFVFLFLAHCDPCLCVPVCVCVCVWLLCVHLKERGQYYYVTRVYMFVLWCSMMMLSLVILCCLLLPACCSCCRLFIGRGDVCQVIRGNPKPNWALVWFAKLYNYWQLLPPMGGSGV